MGTTTLTRFIAALLFAFASTYASAAFILVEDFEDEAVGIISPGSFVFKILDEDKRGRRVGRGESKE